MFLPGLKTVWADLEKLFAFAPIVAAIDPAAAGGIAEAQAVVTALQPTVKAVQDAANGALSHSELVAKVTAAVADTSAKLTEQGLMPSATNQHVQAVTALVPAAVAISGLAAPAAQ